MAGMTEEEQDFERISELIAQLDGEEFLLTGLDVNASASPEIELALVAIQEQRARLEEELAEVWARRCSKC